MITERRAEVGSYLGGAFVLGWISCSGFYRIPTLWKAQNKLVTVETKVLPQVQTSLKQADCDKEALAQVAAKAIEANQYTDARGPGWEDLHGCPKVKPVEAPPVAAVLPRK